MLFKLLPVNVRYIELETFHFRHVLFCHQRIRRYLNKCYLCVFWANLHWLSLHKLLRLKLKTFYPCQTTVNGSVFLSQTGAVAGWKCVADKWKSQSNALPHQYGNFSTAQIEFEFVCVFDTKLRTRSAIRTTFNGPECIYSI